MPPQATETACIQGVTVEGPVGEAELVWLQRDTNAFVSNTEFTRLSAHLAHSRSRQGRSIPVATADIQVEAATARIRFEACFTNTKALSAMTRAHKLADRARLSGLTGRRDPWRAGDFIGIWRSVRAGVPGADAIYGASGTFLQSAQC